MQFFPLPNSVLFTRLCSCAGCHRHRQVQLLPEVRVPRAPQPCGGPHQLRALADFQQLHFRVGSILTRGVDSEGGEQKKKTSFLFFVAALLSVIQTATYRRAAGSILPARRLRWKHRGPVVKHKHGAHIHTLPKKTKKNASSILYQAVSHRNGRSFIWTNNSLRSLLLFSFAEGSSCSHRCVPLFFFFLLFCLFLPPASLRRLLRDILGSLRL